LDEQRKWTKYL